MRVRFTTRRRSWLARRARLMTLVEAPKLTLGELHELTTDWQNLTQSERNRFLVTTNVPISSGPRLPDDVPQTAAREFMSLRLTADSGFILHLDGRIEAPQDSLAAQVLHTLSEEYYARQIRDSPRP